MKRLGLQRVHDKIIFDAFNDGLDVFRVYGKRGQPCPWKTTPTKINQKRITQPKAISILEKVKERTIIQ